MRKEIRAFRVDPEIGDEYQNQNASRAKRKKSTADAMHTQLPSVLCLSMTAWMGFWNVFSSPQGIDARDEEQPVVIYFCISGTNRSLNWRVKNTLSEFFRFYDSSVSRIS